MRHGVGVMGTIVLGALLSIATPRQAIAQRGDETTLISTRCTPIASYRDRRLTLSIGPLVTLTPVWFETPDGACRLDHLLVVRLIGYAGNGHSAR